MGAQISLTRDWCIDFRAYSFPKKRAEKLYTNVSAALEKSPNQVGVFFVIVSWSDCVLASHSSAPRKKVARYLAQALFTRTTTSDIFLIPEYFGVSIPAPHSGSSELSFFCQTELASNHHVHPRTFHVELGFNIFSSFSVGWTKRELLRTI